MAHTTIGLDIGTRAIRSVLCLVDGQKLQIREFNSIPIDVGQEENPELALGKALDKLEEKLETYKKIPLDAIGLSVDPTLALSTHKIMPFDDVRILEQVLPQALMDFWKIDENAHLVFEVGEFVKNENENADSEEEENEGGYDIHVVNYPKNILAERLGILKKHDIDPHVAIVPSDAFPYLLNGMLKPEEKTWAVLDIGESVSAFVICHENKVALSRSFKMGGATIDSALAQAFDMEIEEARRMKEAAGFIGLPGNELADYQKYVAEGRLEEWEVDVATLSNTCAQAVATLMSSVRQSLINFATKNRVEPECLYLVGGGARLCGIDAWVSEYFGMKCVCGLPLETPIDDPEHVFSINAAAAALAAESGIDGKCPLNLRHGELSHKGSLAVLQENKWILASLAMLLIISLIFMTVTKASMIKMEHAKLRNALEQTTQEIFGKKMLSYSQIEKEIADSSGYSFIPDKTAFTHFAWISSQVNDNLSDVEMDINSLDIDIQRKIVTIRGEVSGDDGLPKFMQLLEQYECFPDEIQEPKTQKVRDRTSFTLRVDATKCSAGGDDE